MVWLAFIYCVLFSLHFVSYRCEGKLLYLALYIHTIYTAYTISRDIVNFVNCLTYQIPVDDYTLLSGAITSPPDGEKYLFLPGETAKIEWVIVQLTVTSGRPSRNGVNERENGNLACLYVEVKTEVLKND